MYTEYWHLKEKPFELTPDQRFIYLSKAHEEALMRLCYTVIESKGAMLLTGNYGCGKTVLSRVILNELIGPKFEIALITNPNFTSIELLEEIVYQFGGGRKERESKVNLMRALNDILYENVMNNKDSILVIDEAQAIKDFDTFDDLRMLLNLQRNNKFLMTLILIGHLELYEKIKQLPQFKQRLAINYHLGPLDETDTYNYIDHRLKVAGAQRAIFDQEAKKLIYHKSAGIPRVVNSIADMALLLGFNEQIKIIDSGFITKVIEKMEWSSNGPIY